MLGDAIPDLRKGQPRDQDSIRKQLLSLRSSKRLSTRQVAAMSLALAQSIGRGDYAISHARMIQIERGESVPSIFKLYSLGVIYGVPLPSLLQVYVDSPRIQIGSCRDASRCQNPSIPGLGPNGLAAQPDETMILPKEAGTQDGVLISNYSSIPDAGRRIAYAIVGSKDLMMSPIVRPGCVIQFQPCSRIDSSRLSTLHTEDRPIYLLSARAGLFCAWCEVLRNQLVALPHPLSGRSASLYSVPADITIVGRITAIVRYFR